MTEHATRSHAGVELLSRWDACALQTEALTPMASSAAVLMWSDIDLVEAGPSPALAHALAAALVRLGLVAYRWRGPPPVGGRRIGLLGLSGGWSAVEAQGASAVARMFDEGWAQGDQVALIGGDDARALDLLSRRDLRGTDLQEGEVLVAAIVDGAGALVVAASATGLARVTDTILGALPAAP